MPHTPDLSRFQEKLRLLQQDYLQRLPEKIMDIEATWAQWLHQPADTTLLITFHRQVHTIIGSSSNYQLHQLSSEARVLEQMLHELLQHQTPLTHMQTNQIAAIMGNIKGIALAIVQKQHPQFEQHIADDTQTGASTMQPTICTKSFCPLPQLFQQYQHTTSQENAKRRIFIVEEDDSVANDLAMQIVHFGYDVITFGHIAMLKKTNDQPPPAAILMDIVCPDEIVDNVALIRNVVQAYGANIPIVFMSLRDDVVTRLHAVRAGGLAYFTKPVNVSSLIDTLDALTTCHRPDPYRIIIIDDDPATSQFYQHILTAAGMITCIVNNPLRFMAPLVDFMPDLILMDVHMPECNGLELAAVIRQQEAYVGIPIVFLSAETNIDTRLNAMYLGGDDFISKSAEPGYIISSVSSRAERSRILRRTMTRDSLTGLLNHTATKENLAREIHYARRRNTPLAFAMIDIDHFKVVNDTYGHPTGDRVLKSLSRVLQQRLRKTDIIGRYGGEEFAVMLPDTDATVALRVLDDIRNDFSHIRQRTDEHEFTVTFSCGIADFPTYDDATTINKVADQALYEAKRRGRNNVVVAS